MNKLKSALAGAGAFAGRHKKLAVVLALLVVAAVALLVLRGRGRRAALPAAASTYVRTVTLEKGTLEDSISATGTVQSSQVSNVTTDLKYTVKTVNVQVGDSVQAGDVICTLDTSDLEESIQKLQESLADAKATAQKQYEKAQASLTEAEENVKTTYNTMQEAESARNTAKSAYDTANAAVSGYQTAVDTANQTMLTALKAKTDALNAYVNAGGALDPTTGEPNGQPTAEASTQGITEENLKAYKDTYTTAASNYNDADQALKTAQANLQTAQSASNYSALSSAYTQAENTYQQAKTAYENAVKTSESAEETRDTALESYNKAGESDELEDLESQLAKCTLTAETSGKVTAVNATVGSVIDGAAATIQDTDSLKIAITIAEYDIDSVREGMRAVITSDVIDGEINGTLTQISPTATGGGSSSSTFAAEVTVDDANSGLLIGTNAKVQIIQSTTENVFTVPLDAIGEKEDGTSVIYVRTGEEGGEPTFEEVPVTVGATNDYYAEISGIDLEEGMVVRAAASLEDATEEVTAPTGMMGGGRPGMGG